MCPNATLKVRIVTQKDFIVFTLFQVEISTESYECQLGFIIIAQNHKTQLLWQYMSPKFSFIVMVIIIELTNQDFIFLSKINVILS